MSGAVEAFAPGRVNLLGEHTDYTGGLVLPLAIDRGTRVRARRRDDGRIVLRTTRSPEPVEVSAERPPEPRPGSWATYVLGVVAELWERADLRAGCELEIAGDVPEGAGLSSSASLTVACARALDALLGTELDGVALAQLCQRAEQRFAGVQCGIMDQAAAALLAPGEALFLDCHSLAHRRLRLPPAAVVVVHSGVRHALAESGYNTRVAECAAILERLPGHDRLGALAPADLADAPALPPPLGDRLAHVVAENQRVREGLACLESGDLAGFGALMLASHASLRDRYQVSCPELDALVETLRPLVHGAKMTGAGFGGAAVALAPREQLDAVRSAVAGAPLVHAFHVGGSP